MSRSDSRSRRSAPATVTAKPDRPRKSKPLVTLHERIRSDIERRILSGKWRPGDRIPFEHELVEQYDCSRMTVSKALSALVDAGLIVRRRRAGTVVARPHVQLVVLEIPDIPAVISSRGLPYEYQLLSSRRRAPNQKVAAEVELSAGRELYSLKCLHIASGRPFALEYRLMSLAAVPQLANVDFSEIPPGTWLFEHVSWTEARHRITAFNADDKTADALAVPAGAACLSLERETWRRGERITIVRQIFPGEEFELIAKFAPARA